MFKAISIIVIFHEEFGKQIEEKVLSIYKLHGVGDYLTSI